MATEDGLATAFLAALAGQPTDRIEMQHPAGQLLIEAVVPDAEQEEAIQSRLNDAAGVILVTGHIDEAGLESLRRLRQRLPANRKLPQAHALHREQGRAEFKLSCPSCGQKLWVGDAQEGRPGRCPGCRQTFLIPSQARHLAASLQLDDDVPIRVQFRGDTATAVALVHELAARLAARISEMESRQKNMTMRIVIDGDAAKWPDTRPH